MEIKLFKPHQGQLSIINALEDEHIRYIVVNCGRRFGKTELALNSSVKWALEYDGSSILIMSARGDQRKTVFSDFLKLFEEAPFIEYINRTNCEVRLKNGSQIIFRIASYPSVEAMRGKKFNYIVLDEFALYRKEVWESILQPTLATYSNFKVLIMSTPRGKGQFYDLYLNAKKYTNWASFHSPTAANPLVSEEFLIGVKEQVSNKVYRQEYLAEFLSDVGALFENIETNISNCSDVQKGEYLYAGIDLGFKNDFCVIFIINGKGEWIYWDRFNNQSLTEGAQRLAQPLLELQKTNNIKILIENNNYQGVSEMIKKLGVRGVEEHFTTSKNKNYMIENLINKFQTNTLTIPNDEILLDELRIFEYKYNPVTKNISYSAPEGLHDDCVMSLALAHYANNKKTTFRIL